MLLFLGGLSPTIRPSNDLSYCSAKLPPVQPLAHIESEVKERFVMVLLMFIVLGSWKYFTFIKFLYFSVHQVIHCMLSQGSTSACFERCIWSVWQLNWCLYFEWQKLRLCTVCREGICRGGYQGQNLCSLLQKNFITCLTVQIQHTNDEFWAQALHGEEIMNMRLKVMVAEPYNGEDRRKRIKMDVDN